MVEFYKRLTSMEEILQVLMAIALLTSPVMGSKCPDNPRGETKKYHQSCLEFIKKPYYYPQAVSLCREQNGHLVTIESKEKQQWLARVVTDELFWVDKENGHDKSVLWLGISRKLKSGSGSNRQIWYNDNGESNAFTNDVIPINYTNWDIDEPDPTNDRNCAAFSYQTSFRWRASVCSEFPYSYLVVCQYDGPVSFFSKPALCVTIFGLVALFVVIGVVLYCKCYRKRRELKKHLRREHSEESIYSHHEYHIKNTDNDVNGDQTKFCCDKGPVPNAYAPVTNITSSGDSYHNFNILSDTGNIQDKLHHKDLSLGCVYSQSLLPRDSEFATADYRRSVSAPESCPPPYPSAPSETCSVVMEDEELNYRADETFPLHLDRPDSIVSNNLNA